MDEGTAIRLVIFACGIAVGYNFKGTIDLYKKSKGDSNAKIEKE